MLIHIGYHKTGTTFLQTGLFGGRGSSFSSPWKQHIVRRDLILPSEFEWDPARVRRRFMTELDAVVEGAVPVMSDERLSGSPHAGGYDSARTARRLAEVFPEARVLIGIREQSTAIRSMYQQYIRNGGSAKVESYLYPRHPDEVPGFRFEHFAYDALVGLYHELFGERQVLVLPYEWLRADPVGYARRVCDFCAAPLPESTEGDRYPALSPLALALKRHANRLLYRNTLNPSAPLYVKNLERRFERLDALLPTVVSGRGGRRIGEAIEAAVVGRYEESNRRTAERIGRDLASYGYAT